MTRRFLAAAAVGLGLAFASTNGHAQVTIRIPGADCAQLIEHRPAPDVAYEPGVDVRGRPVPPADLPGSGFAVVVPEEVEFDISFNPLRGNAAGRFARSELIVGRVRFNLETGQATFNGQPLTDPEQAELTRKCQRVLRKRR